MSKPLEEFTAVDVVVSPQPLHKIATLHAGAGRESIKKFERSQPNEIQMRLLAIAAHKRATSVEM